MVTITVNERTKAGKLLLQTAQLLAEHSKGIIFEEVEELALIQKMKDNKQGKYLNEKESANFLGELRKVAKK